MQEHADALESWISRFYFSLQMGLKPLMVTGLAVSSRSKCRRTPTSPAYGTRG